MSSKKSRSYFCLPPGPPALSVSEDFRSYSLLPTTHYPLPTPHSTFLSLPSLLTFHSSLLTPNHSLLPPYSSPPTPHSPLPTPHSSLLTPRLPPLLKLVTGELATASGDDSPTIPVSRVVPTARDIECAVAPFKLAGLASVLLSPPGLSAIET